MKFDSFTKKSQESIHQAQHLADTWQHAEIDVVHLVLALVDQERGVVAPLLEKCAIDLVVLRDRLQAHLRTMGNVQGAAQRKISSGLEAVLKQSSVIAEEMKDEYVSTEHLFLASVRESKSSFYKIAVELGIREEELLQALKSLRGNQRVTDSTPEDKYDVLTKYGQDLTQFASEQKLDPVIGRDQEIRRVVQVLSRRRKNNPVLIGEPGVGKTAIAEGLAQRIVARDVPEGLQGKRVIALDLGAMLAGAKYRGEFEDRFKAFVKEVIESDGEIVLFIDELHTLVGAGGAEGAVDASNMIKPALARGELRCIGATTLDEYRKYIEKDAALERRFQPVSVDEPTVEDTIAILRGLRERYEIHHGVHIQDLALVSAATFADRYISDRFLPDKAIDLVDEAASRLRMEIDSMPTEIDSVERRMMQLEIEREALLKEKDTASKERLDKLGKELAHLREDNAAKKMQWEREKVRITEIRQLTEALDLLRSEEEQAKRNNNLERAAEILYDRIPKVQTQIKDAQSDLAKLQETSRMLKEEVTPEDIAEIVSSWTNVPVSKLVEGEKEKLLLMEERLRTRVIGQEEAVAAVSDAVRRARSGLQDPNRPVGSFIFLGPTGVGKTELARSLAEFLFDDERTMLRVDMSEFMEKHAVARLLGAPPGYVGYEEGGYLTEHIRRRPYSVILFDEIEKAHADVFNLLLQILDDGRLTDGHGRTVNFTNTIVIMTSNLGGELIQETLVRHPSPEQGGEIEEALERDVLEILRQHFRPEFLNRVDEIILFHSLSREHLMEIVRLQLARVAGFLEDRKIILQVTQAARNRLAEWGYDPVYGARPLKRVIQKRVLDRLAKQLLESSVTDGDTVMVDALEELNGDLTFSVVPQPMSS